MAQTNVRRSVFGALIVVLLIGVTTGFPLQVVRNVGSAMEPILRDRQLVVLDKLTFRLRPPKGGDLVMLQSPLDPNQLMFRRVIAREGETVKIADGHVYINNRRVDDEQMPAQSRTREDWGPQLVPSGFYFVLSDHRSDTNDSREWGFVPRRYIVAKIIAAA
jgi:signal peptidase I